MMYVDFTAGAKDYKLRLSTRDVVALETKLGCNPLALFGDGDKLPTITEMVTVLYFSMQQLNHGISMEDTYGVFDAYLEEHAATDFIPVILEIYKASGLIPKGESGRKNA